MSLPLGLIIYGTRREGAVKRQEKTRAPKQMHQSKGAVLKMYGVIG